MFDGRATGTNALHAVAMAALVVATAFVVGYVVFDLEAGVLPSDPPPDASFRFAHDPATDTLVVTHYGGDNLDADRVLVVDQGFEPIGNFSAGANVSAGDSATLTGIDADDSVYVLWVSGDGEYRTLASWNADGSAGVESGIDDEHTANVLEGAVVLDGTAVIEGAAVLDGATVVGGRALPHGDVPEGGASTATFLLRME
jgi:hypothetical protein